MLENVVEMGVHGWRKNDHDGLGLGWGWGWAGAGARARAEQASDLIVLYKYNTYILANPILSRSH